MATFTGDPEMAGPQQIGSAKRITLSELLAKQIQLIDDIQTGMGMGRDLPTLKEPEMPQINALESMFSTINKNNEELDRIRQALNVI